MGIELMQIDLGNHGHYITIDDDVPDIPVLRNNNEYLMDLFVEANKAGFFKQR